MASEFGKVFSVCVAVVCGMTAAAGVRLSYDIAPDKVAETVGADVKRYLELRTKGGSFTIGGVAPGTVHVGETAFAVSNGLSSAQFKDEEWVIRSIGGDLVLNGKGRGLTLAMVHFLDDECGIRWWSEYEEFVPTGDLALGPLDRRGRPAFARRDIYVTPRGGKNALRFASYSMLNANGDSKYGAVNRYGTGGNCHTFGRYLPAEKHFKEHPEWFIMNSSGKRIPAAACMSSPGARDAFKRQLRINIEKDRERCAKTGEAPPRVYDISQDDTAFYCMCPECAAAVERKGCSGLLLDFVNDLAGSIRADYPDVMLMTFAYRWSVEPPKDGTRAADNVIVRFCNTKSNLAGSILDKDNQWLLGMLNGWNGHARNLAVWDYAITFGKRSKGFPVPGEFGYGALFRAYRDHGVSSIFIEHEEQHRSDMWELKYRLETKLMDNPDADADAIIAGFMDEYYGAAGAKVLAYRRHLWEARRAHGGFVPWIPDTKEFDYIHEEDLAECERLLDEAEALVAADEVRLARVRRARLGLDLLAVHRDREAGKTDSERTRKAIGLVNGDWMRWLSRYPDKKGAWKRLEKMRVLGTPPPERFRGREFLDFDSTLLSLVSHRAEISEDPTSPTGFAVKVPWDSGSKKLDLPLDAGVYDNVGRRALVSMKIDKPLGEGWNWYHIGRARTTDHSRVWLTHGWWVLLNGKRYPEMGNREWDFWASIKFTGPKYGMPPKDGKSNIWIDRIVLVAPEP